MPIVQPTTVNATSTYSPISTDIGLYSLSSPAFFQSGKEVSISVDENSIVESGTLSVATFTVEVTGVVPADGISVSVNIGGSATLGTDYQVTGISDGDTITLTESARNKNFSIRVIDDN